MKILILGASGMLGSAIFNILNENQSLKVLGTVRSNRSKKFFKGEMEKKLITVGDITKLANLIKIFKQVKPKVVINCISLQKQSLKKQDPLIMIPTYSVLPHQLSKLCKKRRARLIQISTDGVFSGKKGKYKENDLKDSDNIYGISKYLGEPKEEHTMTIRTSIIGHEINTKDGLVEWFLSQKNQCECFSNAIFSGFPTNVLAEIIRDLIIPNNKLRGVYHIASKPISKCKLLTLIAKEYGINIKLKKNNKIKINRSLNSDRFKAVTGYVSPQWKDLIKSMHSYKKIFLKKYV